MYINTTTVRKIKKGANLKKELQRKSNNNSNNVAIIIINIITISQTHIHN